MRAMLIRYVDGPYKGDTVETTCSEIEGVVTHDNGQVDQVRYRVNRDSRTAHLIEQRPLGAFSVDDLREALAPTIYEADTERLLAELARRARAGDPVAAGYLRPQMSTPMGGRRGPRPRAGFGQEPGRG